MGKASVICFTQEGIHLHIFQLILVLISLSGFAWLFLPGLIPPLMDYIETLSYKQTEGNISRLEVNLPQHCKIEFSYTVLGDQYTSDSVGEQLLLASSNYKTPLCQMVESDLVVGQPINVRYDSKNPSRAVALNPIPWSFIVFTLIFLMGISITLINFIRQVHSAVTPLRKP
ncbi:DUF3592 domain-containing protein [Deinococcus sp. QL22]|uniref:DUF3592 domain-containing protein n=1 Tax=Deinococcus sp. QL22 TaxID=2939437 RepID=UPI002017F7B0|nr:DUF3592 domain-containing protein [Deinococcus sp. QL22]UQN07944.1 DUF3592 domain-containing protein [Deinococcus sp. QL22]